MLEYSVNTKQRSAERALTRVSVSHTVLLPHSPGWRSSATWRQSRNWKAVRKDTWAMESMLIRINKNNEFEVPLQQNPRIDKKWSCFRMGSCLPHWLMPMICLALAVNTWMVRQVFHMSGRIPKPIDIFYIDRQKPNENMMSMNNNMSCMI